METINKLEHQRACVIIARLLAHATKPHIKAILFEQFKKL